jgi:hypothetical protein
VRDTVGAVADRPRASPRLHGRATLVRPRSRSGQVLVTW